MCATDDFKFKIINNRLDNIEKKITLSLKAVGIANDIAENFDTLINKWEGEMTKLLNDAGVNNVEDIVNPAYKHSCFAIRGCLMDVKELRKLALDACK